MKIIKINESVIKRIVYESVKKILSEDLTYKQMRNILGVEDDDELNAAVAAEESEEIETQIAKDICNIEGVNSLYKNNIFDFDEIENMLSKKYGMKYIGPDDEEESHKFKNDNFILRIYPINYYRGLGKFRFRNFSVNGIY